MKTSKITNPSSDDLLGIAVKSVVQNTWLNMSGLIVNQNIRSASAGDKQVTFNNVLNDTHVASCVQARKSAVLNYDYEIRSDDENIVKFCEDILANIGYEGLVNSIMDAVLYGYSVIELYYWYSDNDSVVPNKAVAKPIDWFEFDVYGLCRFRNDSGNSTLLPYRKFLVVQHKPTYNNPYGDAVLSKCLAPVVYKSIDMAFWLRYIERFGMPHFVGKVDNYMDNNAVIEMQDHLEGLIQDASAIISKDDDITSLNPGSSGQAGQYMELIKHCNDEISKAILSQTLTTELQTFGSYAASNTHFQVYQQVTESDVALVRSHINQLLRWAVELNFDTDEFPEILIFPKDDVDKELAEVTDILTKNGTVKFTKKYYIERFGFADDEFEIVDKPNTPAFNDNHCHQEFALGKDFKDQVLIDELADHTINNSENIFNQIGEQIHQFLSQANSYEEAKENIHKLLPKLDTDELENKLLNALFLSQVIGSVAVKEELEEKAHGR